VQPALVAGTINIRNWHFIHDRPLNTPLSSGSGDLAAHVGCTTCPTRFNASISVRRASKVKAINHTD
jgi:hypothetical protein